MEEYLWGDFSAFIEKEYYYERYDMKSASIKANWIFNVANKLISYIIPLIVTPYVSRIFGADGIGINSYTTANVTYFVLFCMLGISGYGERVIAINRDNKEKVSKLFWELTVLHGMTSFAVLTFYGVLVVYSNQYRVYYLVNLITVLAAVIDFNWFFAAYERFKFISVRNCVLKVFTLILTFLLIHEKEDLALFIGINAVATFLANFSVLFGIKKYVKRVPLKQLRWFRHVKEVLVYFVPTIAASVYSILDKSVINWITGSDAENGYYEQAYKLMLVINAFVHSLETVSAPRMSNLFANGTKEEFTNRLNRSIRIMLFMATPCAFGLAAIAPTLIPVFLGTGYDKVISIIYVFMPLVVVVGFSVYVDGLYLVPSGQRGKSAVIVCVGAALNVGLNIFFVVKMASVGAAIATLITEMVICGMMMYLSKEMIQWRTLGKSLVKYGLTGVAMFIGVRGVSMITLSAVCSLLLQIFVGVCCYVVLLTAGKDEFVMKVIRQLRKK